MYYALIYQELLQNIMDISNDARKVVYRLQELKKRRIKPYIQYNVDAVLVDGKHI